MQNKFVFMLLAMTEEKDWIFCVKVGRASGAAVDHMQGLRGSFKISKILQDLSAKSLKVLKIFRKLGQDQYILE